MENKKINIITLLLSASILTLFIALFYDVNNNITAVVKSLIVAIILLNGLVIYLLIKLRKAQKIISNLDKNLSSRIPEYSKIRNGIIGRPEERHWRTM